MSYLKIITPDKEVVRNQSARLNITLDEETVKRILEGGYEMDYWAYMEVVGKEDKLCPCCKKKHEVQKFHMIEFSEFRCVDVSYPATYEYCSNADKYIETEEMMEKNSKAREEAYEKVMERVMEAYE